MRQLVTAVVLALVCSACVGDVVPKAGAEDAKAEASAELGELTPGGIGGDLDLGGVLTLSRAGSSGGAVLLATLDECYAVARAGREAREVIIRLGKPRPEADPSVWICSYLVEGIPAERRRTARGADSLQALQCAIQAAKVTIAGSGLVCTWNTEPGDIGIPGTIPTYEGSGFAQRIEQLIEREVEAFTREISEAKKRPPPG